jgi:hypothetical protein
MGFAGDDRLFVAECGRNGKIQGEVWDLAEGRKLRTVQFSDTYDYPADAPVTPHAISPDGRTLAAPNGSNIMLLETATGRVRHKFPGDTVAEGMAFSLDGKQLAAGSHDGGVVLWDVRGDLSRQHSPPDTAALNRAWVSLGSDDAPSAFDAIRLFATFPDRALPFLARKLQPVPAVDPKRLQALLAALESPDAQERDWGVRELEPLMQLVAPAVREVAKSLRSEEVRQRLDSILGRTPSALSSPELQDHRAVEAVEWIATPEAEKLLENWADGARGATLTEEAKSALGRLRTK